MSTPPFPGSPLQLDLLTAVSRLQQIADEGGFYGDGPVDLPAEQLLSCDLPRLRGHLTPAVVAWDESVREVAGELVAPPAAARSWKGKNVSDMTTAEIQALTRPLGPSLDEALAALDAIRELARAVIASGGGSDYGSGQAAMATTVLDLLSKDEDDHPSP